MPRYWKLINGFECWVSHPQDLSSSFPLRLCCWKVGFFKTVRAKRLSPATWMTNWYYPDINSQRKNKFCMYYLQKKSLENVSTMKRGLVTLPSWLLKYGQTKLENFGSWLIVIMLFFVVTFSYKLKGLWHGILRIFLWFTNGKKETSQTFIKVKMKHSRGKNITKETMIVHWYDREAEWQTWKIWVKVFKTPLYNKVPSLVLTTLT